MSNIYDVARLAGVSTTTVSHVLNGTRFVSQNATDKVMAAVQELNYHPSSLARAMVSSETLTIGLVVSDNVSPFYAELAEGIEDRCFHEGYNVLLCNSGRSIEKEIAYLNMLLSKRVDGVIYMTYHHGEERLQSFKNQNIPVVTFDRTYEGVDSILLDNYQGGYDATMHLLGLGHRRIGCIAGPDSPGRSQERVQGYLAAHAARGVDCADDMVVMGDWTYAGGYEAAQTLFTSRPHPPTAVFACNDTMAVGVLSYLHRHGYRVPEEVSVVGYDNVLVSEYTHPPLTTIASPIQKIGHDLFDLLLARLSGNLPEETRYVTVRGHLLVRESTAQPVAEVLT